jgi:hypothetical protein
VPLLDAHHAGILALPQGVSGTQIEALLVTPDAIVPGAYLTTSEKVTRTATTAPDASRSTDTGK